jgi:predicted TIM-barrel fold metal-dependent hydrolase
VKKRPYDYIHSNIKFGTQPLEVMTDQEPRWIELLAAVDGIEDILVFSSDYPHFQFDDPFAVARTLPKAWVDKVMWKNSADFFGWDISDFTVVEKELAGASA